MQDTSGEPMDVDESPVLSATLWTSRWRRRWTTTTTGGGRGGVKAVAVHTRPSKNIVPIPRARARDPTGSKPTPSSLRRQHLHHAASRHVGCRRVRGRWPSGFEIRVLDRVSPLLSEETLQGREPYRSRARARRARVASGPVDAPAFARSAKALRALASRPRSGWKGS